MKKISIKITFLSLLTISAINSANRISRQPDYCSNEYADLNEQNSTRDERLHRARKAAKFEIIKLKHEENRRRNEKKNKTPFHNGPHRKKSK